jgi:hypothetical protein
VKQACSPQSRNDVDDPERTLGAPSHRHELSRFNDLQPMISQGFPGFCLPEMVDKRFGSIFVLSGDSNAR